MSRSSLFCLAILVLTLLAGCATSPPAQFYTLAPVHLVELQPDIKPVAIAIGPGHGSGTGRSPADRVKD